MFNLFLTSNKAFYRTLRTIVQGIIGVLIANCDYLVSAFSFSAGTKAVIVALVMAILSPIMKAISADADLSDIDIFDDDDEEVE